MPRSIAVICGMGILLYTTVAGQSQPNSTRQSKFISQPVQEQKFWQEKQLPGNSVLDQMAYKAPANDVFSRTRPKYFREQVWQGVATMEGFDTAPGQKNELNNLQQYIQQDRSHYLQIIKNSWWKDPYKGIGAGILQGIVNDKYQGRKL